VKWRERVRNGGRRERNGGEEWRGENGGERNGGERNGGKEMERNRGRGYHAQAAHQEGSGTQEWCSSDNGKRKGKGRGMKGEERNRGDKGKMEGERVYHA
jgi:hypothetical protein